MKKGLKVTISGPFVSGKYVLKSMIEDAVTSAGCTPSYVGNFRRKVADNGVEIVISEADELEEPEETKRGLVQLTVSINPLEPKGSLPFVRFLPGRGWKISDGSIESVFCNELQVAVENYNRKIELEIEGTNMEGYRIRAVEVNELPGWGDAVKDEIESRKPDWLTDTIPAHDLLESAWGIIANVNNGNWGNERGEWQVAAANWRESYFAPKSVEVRMGANAAPLKPFPPSPTPEAHQAERAGQPFGHILQSFLDGFLDAMPEPEPARPLDAFLEFMEELEKSQKALPNPRPEIIKLLESIGWIEQRGPIGFLNIPKRFGADFESSLLEAIKAGDFLGVAKILANAEAF